MRTIKRKRRAEYISVDPGLTGSGWVAWRNGEIMKMGNFYPEVKNAHWLVKSDSAIGKLIRIVNEFSPRFLVCELPEYMDGKRGNATAKRGDLVKLSLFVGRINEMCHERGIVFVPILVHTWKGQLEKHIIQARIIREYEQTVTLGAVSHTWDAIGIGMYVNNNREVLG